MNNPTPKLNVENIDNWTAADWLEYDKIVDENVQDFIRGHDRALQQENDELIRIRQVGL